MPSVDVFVASDPSASAAPTCNQLALTTLPSTLNTLDSCSTLHGNLLTGTLPPEWGEPGSFTVLKQLTLSDNPGLNGTLPAAWGAANDSLPQLQDLNVSNTGLSGPLPEWGPYPRNLRAL